jgi:UDPglucose--hexose-1-phosphate uridylyltransferase
MTFSDLSITPHRRYNPLLDEWVLVSPQRNLRPWQGQNEIVTAVKKPTYDPNCYLCPGNQRSGAVQNPNYSGCFVFDNDFPALQANTSSTPNPSPIEPSSFFQFKSARGINRVLCYSAQHNLKMSGLSLSELIAVVETWKAQFIELAALSHIDYVQIFENKGAVMGCSNPHPHGQIWAQEGIPSLVAKTQKQLQSYWSEQQEPLLNAYLLAELAAQERIVYQNEHFVVLVPYWAVWPFETLVLPTRPIADISGLDSQAIIGLAIALSRLTKAYDAVFNCDFPYSAGFHQAPCDGLAHPEWTLHLHFYPPLLRSASVKKFQVGYEMLAEAQRDMTAEQSAAILRSCFASLH